MRKRWQIVKLGDVLRRQERFEPRDELTEYSFAGTYSFARGIFVGQTKSGTSFKLPRIQRIRAGDFIYCKIMAWEGAFGIAPKQADNCVMSGAFVAYELDRQQIDEKFLEYFFKVPAHWQTIGGQSTGTNVRRRSLHPTQFEKAEMPLPPLSEQRRIVARIEEVAGQLGDARTLRQKSIREAEALHLSVLHQHFVRESASWSPMSMDQAIEIVDKQVDPTLPDYSHLPHISGENMEGVTCRLLKWRTAEADGVRSSNYLFSPGTILYSKIRPYLRKAVFVDFRGVCSADVYPIRIKAAKLDPQFLKWTLVADPFTDYANRLSGRTRMPKLNRNQLFAFQLECPDLVEQKRIVAELEELQAETTTLKRLQEEVSSEMDAFMPSILDKAFRGEL